MKHVKNFDYVVVNAEGELDNVVKSIGGRMFNKSIGVCYLNNHCYFA